MLSDIDPVPWFKRTTAEIKVLLEFAPPRPGFVGLFVKFGYFGTQLTVDRQHVQFLRELNEVLRPEPPIWDAQVIKKWKAVNNTLLEAFGPLPPDRADFRDQAAGMATMAAFPLLEDVARRITGAWTADGVVVKEIGKEFGLVRGTSPQLQPVVHRAGKRISLLEHKLHLMHRALREDLQSTLQRLSDAIEKSAPGAFAGGALYDRLSAIRNDWLHGSRAEGWEGLLVSLLLAAIYFPTIDAPTQITSSEWRSKISAPVA